MINSIPQWLIDKYVPVCTDVPDTREGGFNKMPPNSGRTRFESRTSDHYYECINPECKFWCINEEKAVKHDRKASHQVLLIETDPYTNMPKSSACR
jgi:hypothetical protein